MARAKKNFFSRLGVVRVNVPNLSGLTRGQAQAALAAVGLSGVDTPSNTENININLNVVDQGTPAGTAVLIGSQVPFTYYNYVAPPNFNPGFNPGFLPYPNIGSVTAYGAGAGQAWTENEAYITWSGSGWGSYTVVASNGSSNNSSSSGGGPPVLLSGFAAGTNYSVTVTLYANANFSGTSASASTNFTTASAPNPGFNPGFANPGFNPGFAPVNDCTVDDAGECIGGRFYQFYYSPSGQFNCPSVDIGPCGSPGFTPAFNEPAFNEPAFNEPDFSNPGFADPGFDITLTSLDLSALFSGPTKSVGIETLVRTTDGLVKAGDLQVGDTLLSANIEGFPYESSEGVTAEAIAWSDNNPSIIPEITTIVNLYKTQSAFAVVINEDIFSQYHYILIKRNGISKFETSVNVVKETDLVYSYDTGSWEPIYLYEIVAAVHDIVSINCEPYDMFFTERMLTHDSSAI